MDLYDEVSQSSKKDECPQDLPEVTFRDDDARQAVRRGVGQKL